MCAVIISIVQFNILVVYQERFHRIILLHVESHPDMDHDPSMGKYHESIDLYEAMQSYRLLCECLVPIHASLLTLTCLSVGRAHGYGPQFNLGASQEIWFLCVWSNCCI